jgi:hypothetical protein
MVRQTELATMATSHSRPSERKIEDFLAAASANRFTAIWSCRRSRTLQPIQPLADALKLRLQFRFDFRRHARRFRKESEHVRKSLLRFRNGSLGVFHVAKTKLCLGYISQREARCQIRFDEINA